MNYSEPPEPELSETEWALLQGYVVLVLRSQLGASVQQIADLASAVLARLVAAFRVDPLVSHEARCGYARRTVASVLVDSWRRRRNAGSRWVLWDDLTGDVAQGMPASPAAGPSAELQGRELVERLPLALAAVGLKRIEVALWLAMRWNNLTWEEAQLALDLSCAAAKAVDRRIRRKLSKNGVKQRLYEMVLGLRSLPRAGGRSCPNPRPPTPNPQPLIPNPQGVDPCFQSLPSWRSFFLRQQASWPVRVSHLVQTLTRANCMSSIPMSA